MPSLFQLIKTPPALRALGSVAVGSWQCVLQGTPQDCPFSLSLFPSYWLMDVLVAAHLLVLLLWNCRDFGHLADSTVSVTSTPELPKGSLV